MDPNGGISTKSSDKIPPPLSTMCLSLEDSLSETHLGCSNLCLLDVDVTKFTQLSHYFRNKGILIKAELTDFYDGHFILFSVSSIST